ncbi:hypothetical protein TNCV_1658411 [Trichonephila clavipes]|nr:hypothetical protein TNCV_1658411 [Trichonephila clavipes]
MMTVTDLTDSHFLGEWAGRFLERRLFHLCHFLASGELRDRFYGFDFDACIEAFLGRNFVLIEDRILKVLPEIGGSVLR